MILVTGATGNIGSVLVRQLAERGLPVRALTRDARRAVVPSGVDLVEGDLGRPESLSPAWEGVDSLFLLQTGDEDTAAVLRSAGRAGVERVVMVSSLLAEIHPESPIGGGALRGEQTVRDSGMSWTILRPGEFASNALWWARAIREHGVVSAAGGDAGSPVIDPADIAAVAGRVLTERDHEERTYPLTGPAEITPRERVHSIGRVLGRDLVFEELSVEEERERLKQFMPEEVADSLVDIDSDADRGPGVRTTVEDLTGGAPRTFEQWVAEHADSFR
ncbi:SDR family oxidoreductase [Actinopolyspora halophila]|uniref:SDR family oxidoreductase n=1 Tax=Actinopolyspora halophila TaxID=1850 RepID=UPI00037A70B6|nr:NAD(P)H-binding protein [Actinopolyspora halophila]